MKKIIFAIMLLVICAITFCFIKNATKPTEVLSEVEASKLANESYLDILVDIENYDGKNIESYKLLETAMRIARELDLFQTKTEPIYIEFIPRSTINTIIFELTGIRQVDPIVEEDFYYSYDKENDYYYIVPVGTDWIHYDKIKSATKKGSHFEIICNVVESDYNDGNFVVYDNMKVSLQEVNNKYIKYKLISIESSEKQKPAVSNYTIFSVNQYGNSELNRQLEYYSFEPKGYDRTILLNFAIHGFEGKYDKDGQVLVDTANKLIDYYKENSEAYRNTRLIIIPCSNPDGLEKSTTSNANGIDLNRDFDIDYETSENETSGPFSASESKALRVLTLGAEPDVVIDFHGWEGSTIGDASLAEIFEEEMNLKHKAEFNSNCSGYFSYWAHNNGAEALFVQFVDDNIPFEKLVNALDKII